MSSEATKPETVKGLSQAQLIRRRFFGHTAAMVSLTILACLILFVMTSIGWGPIPGWWKHTYTDIMDVQNSGKPTITGPFSWGDHPFGQDTLGRDMFAMVMRGAQQSIMVMFLVGTVAGVIGVVTGALAGYFRGPVEAVIMRTAEAIAITPLVLIAGVLGKLATNNEFGKQNGALMFSLFIGALIWFGLSRLVRAEFLSLREREFVDAAKIAGARDGRIVFKHILPNAVGVVIVNVTMLMAEAILLESALSYLGLGIKPPDVSLGQLIVNNQEAFTTRPWLFWWPGVFIVTICLCINFIGDGMRDAFDPRQKKFAARGAKAVDHPELDELDEVPAVLRPRSTSAEPVGVGGPAASMAEAPTQAMSAPAPGTTIPAAALPPEATPPQPAAGQPDPFNNPPQPQQDPYVSPAPAHGNDPYGAPAPQQAPQNDPYGNQPRQGAAKPEDGPGKANQSFYDSGADTQPQQMTQPPLSNRRPGFPPAPHHQPQHDTRRGFDPTSYGQREQDFR